MKKSDAHWRWNWNRPSAGMVAGKGRVPEGGAGFLNNF
jgi:hypothetical protein